MTPVIDFHTHILPEIDDGSSSLKESITMLRAEAKQGIQRVVATPHFYADHESPQSFLARRREAQERLREAMQDVAGLPQLSVGAEVHFFEGISDSEHLSDMAIEATNCVLIEMPMHAWSDRNLYELVGIRQKRKLIPVIAHIDRYIGSFWYSRTPDRLAELPVLVQANASFFIRKRTQRKALRLIRENKIHLLGSDCHNLDSRPPNLYDAVRVIRRSLGSEAIKKINLLEQELMAEEYSLGMQFV